MKKLIYNLTNPIKMDYWWQDIVFALPRIICGYLLAFDFGVAKFGMPWSPAENNLGLFEVAYWFPNDVAAYGGLFALFPAFLAWMGAFSEAVGGLLLIFGFQTRLFSLLIICTMIVAGFVQHAGEGIWNMLPAMAFLFVCVYTSILGSGRFGIDYLLTLKNK
jgi:putative oxidoreductase